MKSIFDLNYNPPAWTPADKKTSAMGLNYSLDPALDQSAWESLAELEAMKNGNAPMPSQQDLSRSIASEQPQQVQNSVKQSVSMSGAMPQGNEDYFQMMKDAQDRNQANVNGWVQEQKDLADKLANEETKINLAPGMAFLDSWTGGDTLRGYTKPQTEEEKQAVIQQLKNGILKAQQGLSDDEINMFKTLYNAKMDEKWKRANLGLEREKLDILKDKTVKEKAPTGEQYKAGAFGQRAMDANNQLESIINSGFDPTSASAATQRSSLFPGALMGENSKLIDQAERNFINSILRRESGASISKPEFANAELQYFPRMGDTPEVLAQKAANRLRSIEGLKLESQGAWKQFNGNRFVPNTKQPENMTREEKIKFLQGG